MKVYVLRSGSMHARFCYGQLRECTNSHTLRSIAKSGCENIVHYCEQVPFSVSIPIIVAMVMTMVVVLKFDSFMRIMVMIVAMTSMHVTMTVTMTMAIIVPISFKTNCAGKRKINDTNSKYLDE